MSNTSLSAPPYLFPNFEACAKSSRPLTSFRKQHPLHRSTEKSQCFPDLTRRRRCFIRSLPNKGMPTEDRSQARSGVQNSQNERFRRRLFWLGALLFLSDVQISQNERFGSAEAKTWNRRSSCSQDTEATQNTVLKGTVCTDNIRPLKE